MTPMTTITRALAALPRSVLVVCGSLGVVSAVMAVVAMVAPQWIEDVLGVSPDGGSGEFEVGLAVGLALAAVLLLAVAFAGVAASRAVARSDVAGAQT